MIRRAHSNGFTLVELLVSLVILSATAGLLLSGLIMTRTMADRAKRQSERAETVLTAQTIIRERIEAIVASTRFDTFNPIVDMRGGANIFSFFAPPAPSTRPTSVERYRLVRSAPGDLVLYSVLDVADRIDVYAPGEVGWTPTVLLTGVEALDIDYFGAAPPDGQRRWRREWIERPQPPELVRLRVTFKQGDSRVWPDLIVRPASTVNSSCQIDRFSGNCAGQT
ncbi:MAG: type II secretion system protein J [Sphingomonadaceae bacterium]